MNSSPAKSVSKYVGTILRLIITHNLNTVTRSNGTENARQHNTNYLDTNKHHIQKRFPLSPRPFSKTTETNSRVLESIFPVDNAENLLTCHYNQRNVLKTSVTSTRAL
ncbi:hypothetical protein E2C01_080982 [Portunus trituberculatus]|uniref:Uncharacterized protein n=1 Tax=Portunus trituberculatus TaxID=210409 RepID=A0A5B7IWT5_PORTR|nr:hypothetical protein [Portunus trituberculatus]